MSETEATDADLHANLEKVLAEYPKLRDLLPSDWPRAPKYGVTVEAMKAFTVDKEKNKGRYWHILNLPLCVHYAGPAGEDPKGRSLIQSLLRVLNDFATRFGELPGARKTLEPLWTKSAWNIDPPEIWSILATAFLANTYANNGCAVLGFGMKIGTGDRDADIRVRQPSGQILNVDVEAWHAVRFSGLEPAAARAELLRRVEEKCGAKFRDLPEDEVGVAAIVCMAAGAKFDLMMTHADLAGLVKLDDRYQRQYGYVYWVGGLSDGTSLWANLFDEPGLRKYLAEQSKESTPRPEPT